MALRISPRSTIDAMVKGEEISLTLDITAELRDNTVGSYTFKIYDNSGEDVTVDFGGGSSISSGIITFGIKAFAVGTYAVKFIVTCNETLPDSITVYEFYVVMAVKIV